LLLSQKSFVKLYSWSGHSKDSPIVKGDLWMALTYNGDAMTLIKSHPRITYVVPQEGANLWIDYLVVMQASNNKTLAMEFINFLNEPRNAAQLASYLMYATANKAAKKFLPPEHLNNPVLYPDEATIDRSEVYKELPPRIVRKRNQIFSKLVN